MLVPNAIRVVKIVVEGSRNVFMVAPPTKPVGSICVAVGVLKNKLVTKETPFAFDVGPGVKIVGVFIGVGRSTI